MTKLRTAILVASLALAASARGADPTSVVTSALRAATSTATGRSGSPTSSSSSTISFAGGPVPRGLANVNQDASTDVLDVFFLVNHLFSAGDAPACTGT